MLILQEADEILYRSALSVERRCYKIELPGGEIHDLGNEFTKTQIVKRLKEGGKILNKNYKLHFYRESEPLSHAIKILDNTIRRVLKNGDEIKLFLSPPDKSNFRNESAVTRGPCGQGYKAGRPPRPLLYNGVRQHMIDNYNVEECYGYEADDALGYYSGKNTILSHIDKDIKMIPGVHLDWVTNTIYTVRDSDDLIEGPKGKILGGGIKWFYFQLLTGDRTDNIPGVPTVGPKTAYGILHDAHTEDKFVTAAVRTYMSAFGDDWRRRMLEIADLIWICRKKGQTGSDYLGEKLCEVGFKE